MFPIFLQRDEDDPTSDEPFAYLVAKNGHFLQKRTPAFRVIVRAEITSLVDLKESAEYLLPPIPPELGTRILEFFRAVYRMRKTEAILLISYNPSRGTFRLDAPPQEVTAGHCKYEMPLGTTEGFHLIGTVHSHGSMGAFHSHTDKHDETTFDGVHLTFGHVDVDRIDIVASLAIGQKRFTLDVTRVLGGCRLETPPPDPVLVPPPTPTTDPAVRLVESVGDAIGAIIDRFRSAGGRKRRTGFVPPPAAQNQYEGRFIHRPKPYVPPKRPGYVFDLPPNHAPEETLPDPAWFDMVKEPPPPPPRVVTHAFVSRTLGPQTVNAVDYSRLAEEIDYGETYGYSAYIGPDFVPQTEAGVNDDKEKP